MCEYYCWGGVVWGLVDDMGLEMGFGGVGVRDGGCVIV